MTSGQLIRTLFRWLVTAGIVGLGVLGLFAFFARFGDGPIGPLPGGVLRGGDVVSAQGVDWSFADDVKEVELQLEVPPRSRTVWIVVHGGQLYVPSAFVGIPGFEQWPREAEEDGRAVLRLKGRRYPVQAVRVRDPRIYARVEERLARKYGMDPAALPDPDGTWIFRLDPRPAG
jgi:hypothetical protein